MDAGQYTLDLAYREDGLYFDAILITDDLALDPATLPNAVPGCVEANILVNGSFEDGLDPWVFDNASPAYEIVDDAQEGDNALKVTIAAAGSSEYIPALAQPGLSFITGQHYTFSVFLKGSYDGMQVYLKPQERGGSWTGYGAEYKTITTEWAEYSVTTPVFTGDVATADVSIWLGIQAGDVYIDHARFYEGDYVPPCSNEGVVVLKATKPEPKSGSSDLSIYNLLSWTPGEYADSHNVYLGTDQQAVTDATVDDPMGVLVSMQQVDPFYDAKGDYDTTYYWRVDEVNETDMTITPGSVWSFTTKPIGLFIPQSSITATASSQKSADQGPEKTIDGSGLTGNQHGIDGTTMWASAVTTEPNKAWIRYDFDKLYKMPRMLIWNYNQPGLTSSYAIKGVTIEYSSDGGETWGVLDVNELPKAPGTADYEPIIIDLGGVVNGKAIDAILITANSNYGSFKNYGLSEVKFYYIPVWPTEPSPVNGDATAIVTPTLTWEPGQGAVEHRVFFGTNEEAVTNGSATSYITEDAAFDPMGLVLGQTYFWRVEEVNMASEPNTWSGDTWTFTVSPFTIVDDFESYGSSINTWSGSAKSLDTEIANNGSQSMKFVYDNSDDSGYYTEISVSPNKLASGSNWKLGGAKWLVFYVYGNLANATTERLYVGLDDAVYWRQNIDLISDSELVSPWWTMVKVPLIADQVNLGNVGTLKIGFIQTGSNSGAGEILIDDVRLYKDLPATIVPSNPGDANLVARYKFENNVNDSSSNHIDGTIIGDPMYVANDYPGYGKAMAFDANGDVVDLGPSDPFNFTGSFSISLWAHIDDWGSEWGSVMVATRGEGTEGFQVRRGGSWIAGMQGKTGEGLSFTTRGISLAGMSNSEDMIVDKPALNRWTNIVCIYDAENHVKKVYFDSKLIQESATPEDAMLGPATQDASIGARSNSGNTGFEGYFNGKLDDVRLYNKVLNEAEIRYLADPTP
jgi:hypothetical protein